MLHICSWFGLCINAITCIHCSARKCIQVAAEFVIVRNCILTATSIYRDSLESDPERRREEL